MPVRIYDIAKRVGIESKEVLAKAKELGITNAKVPSSSLDKITGEYLEDELRKLHPLPVPAAPEPPPPAPPPEPPPEEHHVVIISQPPPEPVPAAVPVVQEAPAAPVVEPDPVTPVAKAPEPSTVE